MLLTVDCLKILYTILTPNTKTQREFERDRRLKVLKRLNFMLNLFLSPRVCQTFVTETIVGFFEAITCRSGVGWHVTILRFSVWRRGCTGVVREVFSAFPFRQLYTGFLLSLSLTTHFKRALSRRSLLDKISLRFEFRARPQRKVPKQIIRVRIIR